MKLAIFLFVLICFPVAADDLQYKIDRLFNPVVKVQLQRPWEAGGSGTIIYSESFEDVTSTFILTNYHVIQKAIRHVGKEKESREQVKIDYFEYTDYGNQITQSSYKANILLSDQTLDIALLKLINNKKKFPSIKLPPTDFRLKLLMPVYIVGFPYLKQASVSVGQITATNIRKPEYEHGNKAKLGRTNGDIHFGYSGGAVFNQNYELIGIPQSVGGFNIPINSIGYFITIYDIRKFIKSNNLEFIETKVKPKEIKLKPFAVPSVIELKLEVRNF